MAAVAMLAAVSCNKEITNVDPVTPEADAVVYTAYVDGAQTKTYLGETTGEGNSKQTAALWAANDAITIHNGETAYTFTTTDNATSAAQFEYDMQNGEYEAGEGVMAVYPSGDYTADIANKTISAVIPVAQQAQIGTYYNNASVAVAYTEDNTLQFKNATALLMFTINADKVTHVYFEGNNQEPMLGNVNLTLDGEGAVSVEYTDDENVSEVELYAYHDAENKYFEKGETYYIAVGPQTFNNGVTVKIRVDEGDKIEVKSTNKMLVTKSNVILNLGEFTYEAPALEWGLRGSMTNWNSDIPMPLVDGWYVVEGVEITANDEFKFHSNYNGWLGVASVPVSEGETAVSESGGNIKVAESAVYTVSLSEDETTMKLVKTGDLDLGYIDPATADIDKVRVGLTGSKAAWNWEDPSSEKGSLATFDSKEVTNAEDFSGRYTFTMTDVEFAASEQFKIRVDLDGTSGWYGVGTTVSGIAYTGGDNFVVSAAGTYDVAISFTYDGQEHTASNVSAVFTKTSVDPEPEPEPEPTQVRIYVDSSWGWPYIWCWDSNDTQIFAGASWPGTRYHGEENGYYYWNVPEAYVGKTVSLLAVNEANDEQTSDFTGVLLDKSVYFKLEWTQELGCHLVKEDK